MYNFKAFTSIFLLLILVSSCEFAKKPLITPTNFSLSSQYADFNTLVESQLDSSITPASTVTITALTQEKFAEAYQLNTVSIYRLLLTITFTIQKADTTPITHTLTMQKFIHNPKNTSSSVLEQHTYQAMKAELAKQLIAIVYAY